MSKTADQKKLILEVLKKARGAAVSLSDIALHTRLQNQHVLTLLGQMMGEVECVSRATMESTVSMKWEDVDSKWKIAGTKAAAPVKWPPRPGSAPFGSETKDQLQERVKRGKLKEDRLLLAAWLGHGGAREALGARALDEAPTLAAWLSGLSRWKEEVRIRGLAAAARGALPAFETARPGDERPRRAVEAALAYAKATKNASVGLATGTALGAEEAAKEAPEGAARAAATAAYRLGILVSAIEAGKAGPERETLVAEIARELAVALPDADLRAAVKDELGAWALS